MLARAGPWLVFHSLPGFFQEVFKRRGCSRGSLAKGIGMSHKHEAAKGFTFCLSDGQARVRKRSAPPVRPMEDRRRKNPRRKPDFRAEDGE